MIIRCEAVEFQVGAAGDRHIPDERWVTVNAAITEAQGAGIDGSAPIISVVLV